MNHLFSEFPLNLKMIFVNGIPKVSISLKNEYFLTIETTKKQEQFVVFIFDKQCNEMFHLSFEKYGYCIKEPLSKSLIYLNDKIIRIERENNLLTNDLHNTISNIKKFSYFYFNNFKT